MLKTRASGGGDAVGLKHAWLDTYRTLLAAPSPQVAKVLQGGTENELLKRLRQNFKKVKHIKPPASRQDSREMYVAGLGFRQPEVEAEEA